MDRLYHILPCIVCRGKLRARCGEAVYIRPYFGLFVEESPGPQWVGHIHLTVGCLQRKTLIVVDILYPKLPWVVCRRNSDRCGHTISKLTLGCL